MPGLSSDHWKTQNSPYINRFCQPDTIIPDLSNPQSWNRYSYVTNRPVNLNDPTGHMQSNDDDIKDHDNNCDSGDRACKNIESLMKNKHNPCRTDPGLCGGTVYSHSRFLKPMDQYGQNPFDSWTETSYPWSIPVALSWGDQGPTEINPIEFEKWLKVVGDDVQKTWTLGWYDTPFYNAGGKLNGTGCVYGHCYDRSNLNYIGEGMALSKLGLSQDATHTVVWFWKNKTNLLMNSITGEDGVYIFKDVAQETYDMTDIGWNYYNEHYK
jgi:hypothetical protein